MKRIVVPGEIITKENKKIISGAYKENGVIKSLYVGVCYDTDFGVRVVPLNGKYDPKVGDIIIGKIILEEPFMYIVDINSYKNTVLTKKTVESYLNVNDVLLLKVVNVNEIKEVYVEFIKKLQSGVLLYINPKKVPRVIGKSASMLNMIQKYTNTKLSVGANGYVFVSGENIDLVKDALEKIEKFSHVDNLTDKINNFLKNKVMKK